MPRKSERNDPMRCPRCRSRHVQSLSMAYSLSARHEKPDAVLSEFAHSIEPPKRKSALIWPVYIGSILGFVVFASIDIWAGETRPPWFSFDEPNIRAIVAGVITGSLITSFLCVRALGYNNLKYENEARDWERQAVCRRCSLKFTPDVDLSDEGARS